MRIVNTIAAAAALLLVALAGPPTNARAAGDQHSSAAQMTLAARFPARELSYLLLDVRSGHMLAQRWDDGASAIPIGSLVKPFTALAYAEGHQFRFPRYVCGKGMCWLPRGHGEVGITNAVAVSCNAYFTHLATKVTPADVAAVAQRFGLNGPNADATAEGLAGQHGMWRESPQAMAHAYAELLARRSQPGVHELVDGMALAAQHGTAAALHRAAPQLPVLAKTGTAPCTHQPHAPGDGFVVVAWPADSPRYLLLLREHGRPGAEAAATAAQMLRALEGRE